MYNKYFTMKRSELKEAIKAEIKSVLSEAMSPEEMDSKRRQAMIGGGKAEPLAKLATIGQKKKTVTIGDNEQEYKIEKVMANGDILISRDGKNIGFFSPKQLKPVNEIAPMGPGQTTTLADFEDEEDVLVRVSQKDIRNQLDQYENGKIDGDDLANGIEQIVFGDIAPRIMMRKEEMTDDEMDKKASKKAEKEKIGKQASKLSQADEDRYERIKNGLEKLKKKGDEESIKRMKAILGKKDVQKLIKAKGREESSFM